MYIRDTNIIVMTPGRRGEDHAGERFSQGGDPENDLLPVGDELDRFRIILPYDLPDTIMDTMIGRQVHEIIEIPPRRGSCPRRGCDLGGDTLGDIARHEVTGIRRVERGVVIAIAP